MSNQNNVENNGFFSDKLKNTEAAIFSGDKASPPPSPDAAATATAKKEKDSGAAAQAKVKVYVIDDSPTILAVIAGTLKKAGLEPIAHRDPILALDEIKRLAPDDLKTIKAIFSDLEMPGLSGIELLREIRESETTKNIPFVVITSKTERTHIQQAAQLKINGYLLKPVNTDTLHDLLLNLFPDLQGHISTLKMKAR
jgi:two-component system, chemotaxis family, chemotaxis protein CheY